MITSVLPRVMVHILCGLSWCRVRFTQDFYPGGEWFRLRLSYREIVMSCVGFGRNQWHSTIPIEIVKGISCCECCMDHLGVVMAVELRILV